MLGAVVMIDAALLRRPTPLLARLLGLIPGNSEPRGPVMQTIFSDSEGLRNAELDTLSVALGRSVIVERQLKAHY